MSVNPKICSKNEKLEVLVCYREDGEQLNLSLKYNGLNCIKLKKRFDP